MPSLDLKSTYGALLIGVFISIFFQGILSVQAYIYYESFPEDSRKLKALVAIVWTLDFAHLVVICQAIYYYLVLSWGNDTALLNTTIPLDLHLIPLTLSSMACQAYFLHRVWRFSKNNILTGILGAACFTNGIMNIVMAGQTIQHNTIGKDTGEVIAVFAVGAAGDLSMAAILCWYLQREMTTFDNHMDRTFKMVFIGHFTPERKVFLKKVFEALPLVVRKRAECDYGHPDNLPVQDMNKELDALFNQFFIASRKVKA
ncbi:hypothetical protein B0H14DRAFT_2732159 [Mycena olivaceomarginata]|nr:hypothetical protein B0H14DRAFT_2732159 [Mycena olivaceomarginata]